MIYWINGNYGVGKTTIAECLAKELKKAYINDDVSEYKKAKEEMNKLGFTDYNEYLDYLEFKKIQQSRRK